MGCGRRMITALGPGKATKGVAGWVGFTRVWGNAAEPRPWGRGSGECGGSGI